MSDGQEDSSTWLCAARGGKCDGQVLHEKELTVFFSCCLLFRLAVPSRGGYFQISTAATAADAVMLFRPGVDVCYASRSMAPL